MANEDIQLIIYILDQVDQFTFSWDDNLNVISLKNFVFSQYINSGLPINIFSEIELKQGDQILEDSDEITSNRIECYVRDPEEYPKNITLQYILDEMKKRLELSDSSYLAFTVNKYALECDLHRFSNSYLEDLIVIDKENKENTTYNCNIPLSKIVKRATSTMSTVKKNQK